MMLIHAKQPKTRTEPRNAPGQKRSLIFTSTIVLAILLNFLSNSHAFSYSCVKCASYRHLSPSSLRLHQRTRTSLFAVSHDDSKYDTMTVAELKDELRARNLPLSGLKKELQQRLCDSDNLTKPHDNPPSKALKFSTVADVTSDDTPLTKESLLDFDDSVFDRIPTTKGTKSVFVKSRRPLDNVSELRREKKRRDPRTYNDNHEDGESDSHANRHAVDSDSNSNLTRGSSIKVRIVSYGPLGASVRILPSGSGLILRHEIEFHESTHGTAPQIDDILDAWVLKVRDDGKIDVSLRPVGYDKVMLARDEILSRLESTHNKAGTLSIGDRSTPEEIAKMFPGMSKGQFKTGVGALLREGAIVIDEFSMKLVPANERVALAAEPYSGKAPRGWRAPDGCTVFVGNLPFDITSMDLAKAFEKRIGFGLIASVRIATDADRGRSRGFGHVDFFNADAANEAKVKINGLKISGREIRVEETKRADERPTFPKEPRDWGQSSAKGRQISSRGGDDDVQDKWCTVFVGGLPYSCTEDTLKYLIESSVSKGKGIVADVRITKEKDTEKSRGFGYIDFVDTATAERAVNEVNGMTIMGRPIRLDIEGLKRRPRGDNEDVDSEDNGRGSASSRRMMEGDRRNFGERSMRSGGGGRGGVAGRGGGMGGRAGGGGGGGAWKNDRGRDSGASSSFKRRDDGLERGRGRGRGEEKRKVDNVSSRW